MAGLAIVVAWRRGRARGSSVVTVPLTARRSGVNNEVRRAREIDSGVREQVSAMLCGNDLVYTMYYVLCPRSLD